jgi:hypothetical protein
MGDPHFRSAAEEPVECYFLLEAEVTDQSWVADYLKKCHANG